MIVNYRTMPTKTYKYCNAEVTILWQPDKCIHSVICFRGLPRVFDPRRKPWVNQEEAPTQAIFEQLKKCPSGALSILNNPAS